MQRLTVWRIACASILLALSGTSAVAQASGREPVPGDAIRSIVAEFKQHPVVIIGEGHWLRQAGDFYVRLTRDATFQETVQDIVIEFASRNNQPLLDRYIAGEDVPIADVRRIWRDTTKVAGWESPVYAQWLQRSVKPTEDSNLLAVLRVLAGDTSVDWSHIHSHSDWSTLGDNNISLQKLSLSRSLRGSIALWLSSEPTTWLSQGIETEAITPQPASNRSTQAPLTLCSCSAKAAWQMLRKTCFDYQI